MNKLKVQFVSTYIPRECGIATYTNNLIKAIESTHSDQVHTTVVAINDKSYKYDHRVNLRITQDNLKDYKELADRINSSDIDVVFLQHEYGIFGGYLGRYILDFLERNKKPVVITMHTVSIKQDRPFKIIPNRFKSKTKLVRSILKKVDYISVMTESARKYLIKQFNFPKDRVFVIPHGTPEITQKTIKNYQKLKTKLGFQKDDFVLTTFGLITPKKGIEYMIKALPKIVGKNPNLSIKYLIAGEMHPKKPKEYLIGLKKLVHKLDIEKNVIFDNRYLDYHQIYKYLANTDIYITPYYTKEQASSGTLSYAIACGRCIVSTPYIFAYDLIQNKKVGELIDFKSSQSIIKIINKLINNPDLIKKYQRNAQKAAQGIAWSKVSKKFVEVLSLAKKIHK